MDVAWFGLITIVVLTITLCIMLWISYKKLDEIENLLKNSKAIIGNSSMLRAVGPMGRLTLLQLVSFVLTFPHLFCKRGLADYQEIINFPRHLEKLIQIPCVIGNITFFALLALAAGDYFCKL